ncbi:MAG: hypothetical protein LC104_08020 [Bacteroidales bacterium]|nr:hypothetical protein [Bacteroidales bacterium]
MNRFLVTVPAVSVLLTSGFLFAEGTPTRPRFFPDGPQPPPRFFPGEAPPLRPGEIRPLPPLRTGQPAAQAPMPAQTPTAPQAVTPAQSGTPAVSGSPTGDPTIPLPQAENLFTIDPSNVLLRRQAGSWQLLAGSRLLHDFGDDRETAQEALRAMRGLRANQWGRIGSPRVVVEYGLVDGAPSPWATAPRIWLPVDLSSLKAEQMRGTWVVRDRENILLNFGVSQADAHQAVAVAKRYGFNRLSFAGFPNPAAAFLFAGPPVIGSRGGNDSLASIVTLAQERNLQRTGIAVPGVGYLGEQLTIHPHQVEVRKQAGTWVLAQGPDIVAAFGSAELTARAALRAVRDGRFTGYCQVAGLTFFLVNGAAPAREPFGVIGYRFSVDHLRIVERSSGQWELLDTSNRKLVSVATRAEAEQAAQVLRAFRFDTECRIGTGESSLRFFVRSGR